MDGCHKTDLGKNIKSTTRYLSTLINSSNFIKHLQMFHFKKQGWY